MNSNAKRECVGGGKGQALKQDYRSRTWACRDGVRKAKKKAQVELKQVGDVKVSKKDVCGYISSKER